MDQERTNTPWQSRNLKQPTPQQYISLFKKVIMSKSKLLKQLEQLNVDVSELQGLSLNQLRDRCDVMLRSTYSLKYIGIRDNEIGVLSKRLKPNSPTADILPDIENKFLVNQFFFPKPLKTLIKVRPKGPPHEIENIIKFSNPNIKRKQRTLDSKVRGGWLNFKVEYRHPNRGDSPSLDQSYLLKSKSSSNSYSRKLQHARGKALQLSPGKSFYECVSQIL